MKHANSNVNILKKKKISKTIKINNFLRPPSISNNFISPITAKNSNNKNILYNLLYKDTSKISLYNTKNTTNTFKNNNEISTIGGGKYSFNNKNLSNNSTSMGNSINIKEDRIYKENISIRLKLNSKIFNSNNKSKSKSKSINNDLIEKIKEKDLYINKLQKELFQTKEFLSHFNKEIKLNNNIEENQQIKSNMYILNKDEQGNNIEEKTIDKKDRTLKLNSVKFEVNKSNSKVKNQNLNYDYSNHKNNNSCSKKNLETLSRIDSFININNNKNKRNNKNQKSNNGLNINNYQYSFPTNNFMKCIRCFSSSTNRGFRSGKGRYESYKLLPKKTSKNRKKEIIKLTQRKENYNYNYNHDNKKEHSYTSTTLKDLIVKCNNLKSRANNILSNYISLAESLINISNSSQ